jgi:hypothetical protein
MEDNLTIYAYPRQKIFGFFLIAIAFTMYLTVIFPYKGMPNEELFGLCYFISILGIMFNPVVRKKFSVGESNKKQSIMSNISLFILLIGIFLIYKIIGVNGDYRLIWTLLFGLVGVHFLTFIPVHGEIVGILGLVLIINAAMGIIVSTIPLTLIVIIDGTLKLIFGIIYIKLSPINW